MLAEAQFDEVRNQMPATISHAVKYGLPMRMMQDTTGRVIDFIRFELIKLAAMVNVDERLNLQKAQMPIIAREFYEMFPNESIEDVHLCFKRGATGMYDDKLLRLDLAIISNWMRKYLEEKYTEAENQLMAEKENFYQVPVLSKPEDQPNPKRNLLAALETVLRGDTSDPVLQKYMTPEQLKEVQSCRLKKFAPEDNSEENAYQRERMAYKPLSVEELEKRELHRLYIRENYELYSFAKLPTWKPEQEWIESLSETEKERIYKAAIK